MQASKFQPCLLTAFAAIFGLTAVMLAQTRPVGQPAPSSTVLPPGWEDIDPRFVFLTVRLASVETSIDAVNKGLKDSKYKQSNRQDDVATAKKGNEIMDRNAGGPVRWESFYGKTAEKFFYHPVDKNTTYHTETSLVQTSPSGGAGGVQASQGVPAAQRPPQFDYIYRANNEARQTAESDIAKLAGKLEVLAQRKRELEAEQSALWGMIALRGISSRELGSKALYRFELDVPGSVDISKQRQEAIRAAADFIRAADHAAAVTESEIDQNPDGALADLQSSIGIAWTALDEKITALPNMMLDAENPNTPVGRFMAAAKRMPAVAKNIMEAQKLSIEGDRAEDEQRKQTFRALLQQSLFDCAANLFTANDCVLVMAKDWGAVPDMQKRMEEQPMPDSGSTAPADKQHPGSTAKDQNLASDVNTPTTDMPISASDGKAIDANPSAKQQTPESQSAGDSSAILARLSGTKWINAKGATFKWSEGGKFFFKGQEMPCKSQGPLSVRIRFPDSQGKAHFCFLKFDDDLTHFEQTDSLSDYHTTGKRMQ